MPKVLLATQLEQIVDICFPAQIVRFRVAAIEHRYCLIILSIDPYTLAVQALKAT